MADARDSEGYEAERALPAHEDCHGLWRLGDKLVVDRNAKFPNRCVKTNRPTESMRKVRIRHTPFAQLCRIILTLVAMLFVFFLMNFILFMMRAWLPRSGPNWYLLIRLAALILAVIGGCVFALTSRRPFYMIGFHETVLSDHYQLKLLIMICFTILYAGPPVFCAARNFPEWLYPLGAAVALAILGWMILAMYILTLLLEPPLLLQLYANRTMTIYGGVGIDFLAQLPEFPRRSDARLTRLRDMKVRD